MSENQLEIEGTDQTERKTPSDDPYEKLRRDYAAEKAARESAEREAREARTQADRLQGEQTQNHKAVIEHALMSTKADLDGAKRAYAIAAANGDWEAAAEAQAAMVEANGRVQQLTAGAIELDRQAQAPKPQQQTPTVEDRLKAFSPKAQRWLKDHPDVLEDPKRWRIAAAQHQIATEQHGMKPESDEYFQFIEDAMGYGERDETEERPRRKAPQVSAPPSRSGSGGGQNLKTVKLSAAERDHAASLGMTDEAYGKAKLAIKAGKAGNLRYSSDLRGGNSSYDS